LVQNLYVFWICLHFSAFHGLRGLTSLLLECPGSCLALEIQNGHDMTPAELAHLNGHVDLAEMLFRYRNDVDAQAFPAEDQAIMGSPFSARDAGRPTASSTPNEKSKRPISSASVYQVPPPPRPVDDFVLAKLRQPYLDMSGESSSGSGDEGSIAPSAKEGTPSRRPECKEESPQYQEIRSPPVPVDKATTQVSKDPFGTLRASLRWKKKKTVEEKPIDEAIEADDDDDVFLPTSSAPGGLKRAASSGDPFGTFREKNNNNKAHVKSAALYAEELAVTNELLAMLDKFKTNSYSVKEMESMFEQWKKKAGAVATSEEFKAKTKVEKGHANLCSISTPDSFFS